MNINREQLHQLNVLLTVSLEETDYKDKVEENLRNYRKKAQLPGFRKGQVPLGIIRKQYYKVLVDEEVKRLVEQGVNEYIAKERSQILGSPLPKEQNFIDPQAKEFSFVFELGLVPEFDLNLDQLDLDHYHIQVEQKDVDKQIEELQRRFGKFLPKEFASEQDHIHGAVSSVVSEDLSKENQLKKHTVYLKNLLAETLAKFLRSKIGDRVEVNTSELFSTDEQWRMFIGGSDLKHFQAYFTIEQVFEIQPHSLDQELFDKAIGSGLVNSLEEFRNKVKESISRSYATETDNFLVHIILDKLLDQTHFELPSAFLQRSIKQAQKEKIPEHQFQKNYKQAEKSLRYELIKNKLAQQLNVNFGTEQVRSFAFSIFEDQYGKNLVNDAVADQWVEKIMQDREESLKIYERLFQKHLIEALKLQLPLKNKNVCWSDFLQILTEHTH